MNDLMLDVGQANELKLAFRRNNWNNVQIKTLSQGNALAEVLEVIKGNAEIKMIEHLIDCDVTPRTPPHYSVEEHRKGGLWRWNPKIELFAPWRQRRAPVKGAFLRKRLRKKNVLNANVLDYLLEHPELIPEGWKDKTVCFWGTIYRSYKGDLGVRCLRWMEFRWIWEIDWIDDKCQFYPYAPAALATNLFSLST